MSTIQYLYKTAYELVFSRYDRFQDAFEHVSTIIDDIYKVGTHRGRHFVFKCRSLVFVSVETVK